MALAMLEISLNIKLRSRLSLNYSFLKVFTTVGEELAIRSAIAASTEFAPKGAANAPAAHGKVNCPNLLPARRTEIASDRSSFFEILDTQAIVIG